MSFTVVPIHNLDLCSVQPINFADDFVFQNMPDWIKEDKFLDSMSRHDKQSVLIARHALVAEYDANSIGEPDQLWKGPTPQSIQKSKDHSAILANFALWLSQPSNVCYTSVLHAISLTALGQTGTSPIIQRIERTGPLHCHPDDANTTLSLNDVVKAADLHKALASVTRENRVWEALRAFWAALTMYSADRRYPFFWIGLESIFGADDNNGEISYKLCQRIAFFLSTNADDARELFKRAKTCYGTRSKIVHGRWEHDPQIDIVMGHSEAIVRAVMLRLLTEPPILKIFLSKQRDKFLENWVFSRSTDTPPFPA